MALLNDQSRCPGTGCPSKEICRRFPTAGDDFPERAVMTALYVRRPANAAACDEYLERDVQIISAKVRDAG